MLGICVVGFLAAVRTCCCSKCHLLCTPDTEPTGSVTVTLPALTDNGHGCTTCPDFGDTYILDRLDDMTDVGQCVRDTFADACYWALEISPEICDWLDGDYEMLILSLNGTVGTGYAVTLKLCFVTVFSQSEDVGWGDDFSDTLPMDCTTLGTKTLPWTGTEGNAACTTTADATVAF
jgi:hypothetical protein